MTCLSHPAGSVWSIQKCQTSVNQTQSCWPRQTSRTSRWVAHPLPASTLSSSTHADTNLCYIPQFSCFLQTWQWSLHIRALPVSSCQITQPAINLDENIVAMSCTALSWVAAACMWCYGVLYASKWTRILLFAELQISRINQKWWGGTKIVYK